MKTGLNCKVETVFDSGDRSFDPYNMKGVKMKSGQRYNNRQVNLVQLESQQAAEMKRTTVEPIKLRNFVTGKKQRVINGMTSDQLERCADFSDKAYNGPIALRVDDFPMEFKMDVRRALMKFGPLQREFLFNVLVRGLSVEFASKLTRKTRHHWEVWLARFALPTLRTALAEYAPQGKLVLK